jgi:two-component system, NarL family, response regulator YdfI
MIRIFIIAQSIVTQAGLSALLTNDPELEVVGSAIRPDSIPVINSSQVDVVLIEQNAVADFIATVTDSATVLLIDELSNEAFTDHLRLGVRAVLPNDVSSDELINAIKAASVGLTVLHPELLESLTSLLPITRSMDIQSTVLTPREIEVLEMLAEGLGNKAIAQRLHLSEHTIKFHISSILGKLNVSSRTEAVILGARQGWIFL